jgi:hypothetical protein
MPRAIKEVQVTVRHYAFGNVGRDKNLQRSSKHLDTEALSRVRARIGNKSACVILSEINEGDDNNEIELIQRIFEGWRIYGRSTREPILLSPDQPKATARVVWVPNSAVERWSPRRSVLVVHLGDENTSIVTSHPAAGANGQGDRPRDARQPLQDSWNLTIARRNMIKRNLHKRGRNVVEMLDANAYDLDTLPLMKGEKVVVHDATDWGRVWAAEGYRPEFRKGAAIPFNIDSHDGLTMHGTFKKK